MQESTTWTPERRQLLHAMRPSGATLSQIKQAVNALPGPEVTRNSVASRRHRDGLLKREDHIEWRQLKGSDRPERPARTRSPAPSQPQPPPLLDPLVSLEPLASLATPLPRLAIPPAPPKAKPKSKRRRVPWMADTYHPSQRCQFPEGEPGERGFRLCCEIVEQEGPYCFAHREFCFVPRSKVSADYLAKVHGIELTGVSND